MEGKLGKVLTTIQPKIFVKEGSTRASEVGGQKPTLSLCESIFLSGKGRCPLLGRPSSSVLRDERLGFLLSEVDLPRFGVLDSRIIRSLHGLNLR